MTHLFCPTRPFPAGDLPLGSDGPNVVLVHILTAGNAMSRLNRKVFVKKMLSDYSKRISEHEVRFYRPEISRFFKVTSLD
jgi:hypothetical protein